MGILRKKISFSQKKTLILHLIMGELYTLFYHTYIIIDYGIRKQ